MANPAPPPLHDLAHTRLTNALSLFEEFVRATARHADAATLRGLERRFAERMLIQPSYWSQIKGRSRQIGERLARQFEQACHKPQGWLDQPHGTAATAGAPSSPAVTGAAPPAAPAASHEGPRADAMLTPRDADERFMLDLVLTYYRRDPRHARARLLDLLGEVLVPSPPAAATAATAAAPRSKAAGPNRGAAPPAALPADDAQALWRRSQSGVAPLRKRPR